MSLAKKGNPETYHKTKSVVPARNPDSSDPVIWSNGYELQGRTGLGWSVVIDWLVVINAVCIVSPNIQQCAVIIHESQAIAAACIHDAY